MMSMTMKLRTLRDAERFTQNKQSRSLLSVPHDGFRRQNDSSASYYSNLAILPEAFLDEAVELFTNFGVYTLKSLKARASDRRIVSRFLLHLLVCFSWRAHTSTHASGHASEKGNKSCQMFHQKYMTFLNFNRDRSNYRQYTDGIGAYNFSADGTKLHAFDVFHVESDGRKLAGLFNGLQDGEILVMASQRRLVASPTQSNVKLAFDAFETLIYGEVTGYDNPSNFEEEANVLGHTSNAV
ncbi:hypothetical protein MAR_007515 [Mya arenaria]|uniref:Uncharacterized protein n=1 Tax=Mya arenaria TaxID=6604 RepID=A0ABY7DF41_MYAAR|nr:hypothetical protein MAR_007515 [Mya arenaria]